MGTVVIKSRVARPLWDVRVPAARGTPCLGRPGDRCPDTEVST
ncbi:hypothetical protein ACNTMW_10125 [Planosporangium sp. 12N6]